MSNDQEDASSLLNDLKIQDSLEFKPQALEGYSARSFTFDNCTNSSTKKSALAWFGGETTDSESFIKHLRKNFKIPPWAQESVIASELLGTDKIFKDATRVSWSNSSFALQFSSILDDVFATTQLTASPNAPGVEVLTGIWLLSTRHPFVVTGELWRDNKSGNQFIYWHFDAVISSRHFHLKPHPSVQFFLPLFFQSAAFLSETSDPDTRAKTPLRQNIFGVDDAALMPQLAFHSVKDYYHAVITLTDDVPELTYEWTAETVRYGYIFKQVEDLRKNEIAIAIAASALPKVADILVDGFCNYPSKFQTRTASDTSIYPDGALQHFEIGRFLPGPFAQYVDLESLILSMKSDELLEEAITKKSATKMRVALNGYLEIVSNGSGASVPHSINGYVYNMLHYGGTVLGLDDDERADIHDYMAKLLKYVSTMPVDLQDANGLSNLALIEIARKRFNDALQAVNSGILLLKEDRSHIPASLFGNSVPNENPWIKLELFATRAELLYRSGDSKKAKELAEKVLAEAKQINYDGPEIKKVKWILTQ